MRVALCLLLFVLLLAGTGCSFVEEQIERFKQAGQTGQTGQVETVAQDESNSTVPGDIKVVDPVAGQSSNPVLTPGDHGDNVEGIKKALDVLVGGLVLNDLKSLSSCLYGLDEGNSPLSLEELHKEMAQLHPVQWSLISYRPVGELGALVAVSYTMPDGTVRETEPFNVQKEGGLWVVHYNSFAASFHNMARHLFKNEGASAAT